MALVQITVEEAEKGLASLSPELRYMLEEKSVDKEVMALMGHFGVVDGETFAAIASDESSLRLMLKQDFGLDAEGSIGARVRGAKVVNAWRSSRERLKRQAELDADARAEGRPREMPRLSQVGLRRGYEEVHGEVDDSVYPSYAYNNDRVAQIEEGEYKAEALTQVVTFEQAGEESGDTAPSLSLTKEGTVKVTRSKTKVPLPKDPEELRERYATMSMHWEIMKLKHPERDVFKHLTPKTWTHLLDYLLGPTVYKYRTEKGVRLSWNDLLNYEFEIRKKAMRKVTSHNFTIAEAIKSAMKDDELRSIHFTLALVSSGTRSGRARSRSPRRDETPGDSSRKGKGKGKGKQNEGKGKGKKGNYVEHLSPAQIEASKLYNEVKKKERLDYKSGKWNKCIRYNKLMCTLGDSCPNAHVCIRCGERHPLPECRKG